MLPRHLCMVESPSLHSHSRPLSRHANAWEASILCGLPRFASNTPSRCRAEGLQVRSPMPHNYCLYNASVSSAVQPPKRSAVPPFRRLLVLQAHPLVQLLCLPLLLLPGLQVGSVYIGLSRAAFHPVPSAPHSSACQPSSQLFPSYPRGDRSSHPSPSYNRQ